MQDCADASGVGSAMPSEEHGIMPKQETQAWDFIKSNPKFDGRTVCVAIFDSGVDPGAPGLQVTSDGMRKVISLYDSTGSGDVDTSTVRKVESGQITLLSGRSLKVEGLSPCPSGEYRIGVKRGYELMPKTLVQRTTGERKEKFMKEHRAHLNGLQAAVQAVQSKYRAPAEVGGADLSSEMAEEDRIQLEELQTQVEQVTALMSSWSDPGPLYDVVAWKVNDLDWRVVVDTSEQADTTQIKELGEYSKDQSFWNFGSENMMNYSVNVWKDGAIVEIVTNAGSHGTHVAGIVGAYFGENDVNNGVAPGCQIRGFKIGDSRLGSMETGTGLVRALIAARELKVDIINLSYGEPAALPNSGRVAELINELVNDFGVIFVSSASNSGPCLTTVGSPGASTYSAIAVGAVVTPVMTAEAYSMRDASSRALASYTWSSRGPSLDGSYGPTIAAPGGAIAPVPNWTLQKNQLMNGTSMASPNACGCITLLLSALRQQKIAFTPHSVRLAIENTAQAVPDHDFTSVGHGMIQVNAAYDYYIANKQTLSSMVRIAATVTSAGNARGIVLRDEHQFEYPEIEELITVEPYFQGSATVDEKLAFDMRFDIRSTVPWITSPTYLQIPNAGRSFKVQIHPPTLTEANGTKGAYFTGEIQGIDRSNPGLGPVWKIPVTVIRGAPVTCQQRSFEYPNLPNQPGLIHRFFYNVPEGATWATITTQCHDWSFKRIAALSCQQIIPDQSHKFTLVDKYFALKADEQRVTRVPLKGGLTFEVDFGQIWSAMGDQGHLSLKVEFSGVTMEGAVAMSSFGEISKVRIFNALGANTIQIKPTLSAFSRTLYPMSVSPISPLHKDRDMLTKGRLIYNVILTYQYTTEESGIKVLLRSPFSEMLYDSPFESQLIMVYDCNKLLLETVDFNPEWITLPTKGTYTFKMQLRHEDVSILEKLKSSTLQIERQLPKDKHISLSAYPTLSAAMSGSKKVSVDGVKYSSPTHLPCYVQAPAVTASLPPYIRHGDVLYGYMSLVKLEGAKETPSYFADSGLDPLAIGVYPIKFVVPNKPPTSSAPGTGSTSTGTSKGGKPKKSSAAPSVGSNATLASMIPLVTQSSASSPAPDASGATGATSSSETDASVNAPNAGLNMMIHVALNHLQGLVKATNFSQWQTLSTEFLQILPTLAQDPSFKLQQAFNVCNTHRQNPSETSARDLLAACDAVIATVDQTALAIWSGTRHPKETAAERAHHLELGDRLVTAMSLKMYAYAPGSPEHQLVIDDVSRWADPAVVPILAVHLDKIPSTVGPGAQLRNTRKKIGANDAPSVALLQEQLTAIKALGWEHWIQYFQNWITIRSVSNYLPF